MQAAEPADEFVAGTQIKMIRVAEQNLHAKLGERLLRQALYRSGRADGHECGRINHAVRRRQAPQPRSGRIGFQDFEMKIHLIQFSRT
jgi:hypothetical protein